MTDSASVLAINNLKRGLSANRDAMVTAISRTVDSGWWLNGAENKAFCSEFASYIGVEHCLGVANGSDALEIAMRAVIAKTSPKGREVVTVANAGGYTTIACRIVGLTPVYVDIDPASHLMRIENAVKAMGDDTALVVATHLYGGMVDVAGLRVAMDAAGFTHVPILEDCAQAHGVSYMGRKAGSLGDIATFSFYPTKNLGACGDAGAIVTQDDELAHISRQLQQYGWASKYKIELAGGRNSRMDEIQAAVLRVLLPELDSWNARRIEIVNHYAEAAPDGVRMVRSPCGSVAHLAVAVCDDRTGLAQHMKNAGIMTDIHYPVLDCDQPAWNALNWREGPDGLAQSREASERILTLPCYPAMTNGDIERVCAALKSWAR